MKKKMFKFISCIAILFMVSCSGDDLLLSLIHICLHPLKTSLLEQAVQTLAMSISCFLPPDRSNRMACLLYTSVPPCMHTTGVLTFALVFPMERHASLIGLLVQLTNQGGMSFRRSSETYPRRSRPLSGQVDRTRCRRSCEYSLRG